MRDIIVIASKEKDRLILGEVFERIGANTFFAIDLKEAFRLIEKAIPRAIFIVEEDEPPVEVKIREIKRIAPLLPVSILLKQRDSTKAIEYMKMGAFDCAQPPWTETELLPLFRKSLSLTGTEIKFEKPKRNISIILILSILLIFLGIYGIYHYGKQVERKKYVEILNKNSIILPEKNISGIFFDESNIYIASWLTQNIYKYKKEGLELISVKKLTGKIPTIVTDQITNFLIINDDGEIEKRLKNENYTLISKNKINTKISDICFDGMYLWSIDKTKNTLQKRVNNESLDILSEFPINNGFDNIACNNKYLIYYNRLKKSCIKASIEDPQKIYDEFYCGEIINIAINENKLWQIYIENNNAILKNKPLEYEKNNI